MVSDFSANDIIQLMFMIASGKILMQDNIDLYLVYGKVTPESIRDAHLVPRDTEILLWRMKEHDYIKSQSLSEKLHQEITEQYGIIFGNLQYIVLSFKGLWFLHNIKLDNINRDDILMPATEG